MFSPFSQHGIILIFNVRVCACRNEILIVGLLVYLAKTVAQLVSQLDSQTEGLSTYLIVITIDMKCSCLFRNVCATSKWKEENRL